jgi:hypothetical protein
MSLPWKSSTYRPIKKTNCRTIKIVEQPALVGKTLVKLVWF